MKTLSKMRLYKSFVILIRFMRFLVRNCLSASFLLLCPCEEPRFDAVAAGHAADLAVTGRHCTHGAGVDIIIQHNLLG